MTTYCDRCHREVHEAFEPDRSTFVTTGAGICAPCRRTERRRKPTTTTRPRRVHTNHPTAWLIGGIAVLMLTTTAVTRACGDGDPCAGTNGPDRSQCLDEHGR